MIYMQVQPKYLYIEKIVFDGITTNINYYYIRVFLFKENLKNIIANNNMYLITYIYNIFKIIFRKLPS